MKLSIRTQVFVNTLFPDEPWQEEIHTVITHAVDYIRGVWAKGCKIIQAVKVDDWWQMLEELEKITETLGMDSNNTLLHCNTHQNQVVAVI